MAEYILLAAAAILVVVLMLLRTNTAVSFMALCAGSVLLSTSGDNAGLVASSLTSGMSASANVAHLVLLFVPFLVCAVMLRGQIHKTMLPLAALPAVTTALLAALLAVPLLPDGTRHPLTESETWTVLLQYQEFIVGLGIVSSIIMLAATIKKPHDKHKKGRH